MFGPKALLACFDTLKGAVLAAEPMQSPSALLQSSARHLTQYFLFPLHQWALQQRAADSSSGSDSEDMLHISATSSAKRAILRCIQDQKFCLSLNLEEEVSTVPPIALYVPHLTTLNVRAHDEPTIPDHLFELEDLQNLTLDVGLSELSSQISRLSALKAFNIEHNRIRILPIELLRIPTLERLVLGSFSIGFSQGKGGALSLLRDLNITAAALNAVPLATFQTLRLESLVLHMDSAHPPLTPDRIRHLRGLKTLVLHSDAQILPAGFFEITSLEKLRLKCRFLLPNFAGMQNLRKLTDLDLGMLEELEEVPPEIFELPRLDQLTVPHPLYSSNFRLTSQTMAWLENVHLRFETERSVS
jgi:hypothetical protein